MKTPEKMTVAEWNEFVRDNPVICAEEGIEDPKEKEQIRAMIDELADEEASLAKKQFGRKKIFGRSRIRLDREQNRSK